MNLKPSANPSAKLSVKGQNDISFSSTQYIEVHERAVDVYEGAYAVTPRLYQQYLDTDGKLMRHDVTVYEIPVTQTSNPYGGQTVLIG